MKAPFTWPNSSDSSSISGIAAQFTTTNGRSSALAARVDRARDHLLAGPALAADQHVRLAVGHLPDQLEDALHRRAVSDDGAIALAVPQLAAQAAILAREQLLLERLLDDDADLVDLEAAW